MLSKSLAGRVSQERAVLPVNDEIEDEEDVKPLSPESDKDE